MIQFLSKKSVLISSLIFVLFMFAVMFYVNPLIDGNDGSGLLRLQLSFNKEAGIEIINNWGNSGIENFKKYIFTDYIYAFAYALFLASLVSFLTLKKGREVSFPCRWVVYLAFAAAILDWVENTMELSFINDPVSYSSSLFFLHSIFAIVKWLAVTIVLAHIVILLAKRNESTELDR